MKRGDHGPPAAPAWMVTYGDLMGLLLTFFVLIVSFSSIDKHKITEVFGSVQGAFGIMPAQQTVRQISQNLIKTTPRTPRSIERVAREFRTRLQVLGIEDGVGIKYRGDGGLDITLPNQVLFDFGSADLKPDAFEILNQLASSLREVPGIFVEIRGHTDNIPVSGNSVFADNYDLSYQRAKNVMTQMTSAAGLDEAECEVIACGPSQPIASNDTEEGRATNRRVQISVRGDFSEESEYTQQLLEAATPPESAPDAPQTVNGGIAE